MNYHILLTIDVEDWFQVENFKQCIPFSSWPTCELRVEANTNKLLELLDSTEVQQPFMPQVKRSSSEAIHKPNASINRLSAISHELGCQGNPKATFFVLGWLAERLPGLVREIHARGHEVASHGYYHNLCNQQSPDALKEDLSDSKKLLEDITGAPVYGYRAPSFSINLDILRLIQDCGYLYDSSYNSFSIHGRYGRLNLSQNGTRGIAFEISNALNGLNERSDRTNLTPPAVSLNNMFPSSQLRSFSSSLSSPMSYQLSANSRSPISDPRFYELPISNIRLGNRILPWGGGAYFRLIPSPLFKMGVKSILKRQRAYLLYMHPWEVDPEQPRVNEVPAFYKFRHYINLRNTLTRLAMFIETFKECRFVTCKQYLEEALCC